MDRRNEKMNGLQHESQALGRDFNSINPLINFRNRMGVSQRDFAALLGYPEERWRLLERGYLETLPEGILKFVTKCFDDPNDQEISDRHDKKRMGGGRLNQEELEEAEVLAEKGRIIANRLDAEWKIFRSGLSPELLVELTQQLYPAGKQNGIAF
jgi:hypothetical protein